MGTSGCLVPAGQLNSAQSFVPALRDDSPECRAIAAVRDGEPVIVLTGRAGTGKTTFIQHIRRELPDRRMVVLAPTGIAALNASGQTIHSFFKLPPRILDRNDSSAFGKRLNREMLARIELIVIDEVSMVRADLLDAVDRSLREHREANEPFGGVQLLLVGDFLQLPPVVSREEGEMLERLRYELEFAFAAHAMKHANQRWYELEQVHRQADPLFVECLGNIRIGEDLRTTVTILNERCYRPHRPGYEPIVLCPTNARADEYSRIALEKVEGGERVFDCQISGKFTPGKDKLPAPEFLRLKKGTRVMAVKNDIGKQWVNGSLGTVTELGSDHVGVLFDDGTNCRVDYETWEKVEYRWNSCAERIEHAVVGTFTQIPLTPASALTIHKAQGLTLNDVRVDLDGGTFSPGHAYVALSRTRSLEGLSLQRPLRVQDVRLDRQVMAHLARVRAAQAKCVAA